MFGLTFTLSSEFPPTDVREVSLFSVPCATGGNRHFWSGQPADKLGGVKVNGVLAK